MNKRVTLRDVAGAAGVHFTTVGLAVRGDHRLSQPTAAHILTVARRLGYKSDPLLSAMARFRHGAREVFHGTLGYIFTNPALGRSAGQMASFRRAELHARQIGFRVEAFELAREPAAARALSRVIEARGIQGVILSPMDEPGRFPAMAWEKFSVCAIGYSIIEPIFNRVCPHQAHTMRKQLHRLRRLGYRRIGLMMTPNADTRTEHNFLGSYLADQHFLPAAERLPPLVIPGFAAAEMRPWLQTNRPDCVLASEAAWYERLRAMGIAIPRQLGFAVLGQRHEYPHLAGLDERIEVLGELTVDLVVAMLAKAERGIPASPSTTLVESGRWNSGKTVRRVARPGAG
jgi:DNA-binding LacI/PurR family transcriptional regulator